MGRGTNQEQASAQTLLFGQRPRGTRPAELGYDIKQAAEIKPSPSGWRVQPAVGEKVVIEIRPDLLNVVGDDDQELVQTLLAAGARSLEVEVIEVRRPSSQARGAKGDDAIHNNDELVVTTPPRWQKKQLVVPADLAALEPAQVPAEVIRQKAQIKEFQYKSSSADDYNYNIKQQQKEPKNINFEKEMKFEKMYQDKFEAVKDLSELDKKFETKKSEFIEKENKLTDKPGDKYAAPFGKTLPYREDGTPEKWWSDHLGTKFGK